MPAPLHRVHSIVMEVIANSPDWSAARIHDYLATALGLRGGDENQLPSIRTIARWKADAAKLDLTEFQYIRWPQTFDAGLLPWSAAAEILELLGELWPHRGPRFTVRLARWYLRCQQAMNIQEAVTLPGAQLRSTPRAIHLQVAQYLSAREASGTLTEVELLRVHYWIALRGWSDAPSYRTALEMEFPEWETGHDPDPRGEPWDLSETTTGLLSGGNVAAALFQLGWSSDAAIDTAAFLKNVAAKGPGPATEALPKWRDEEGDGDE
ncbi:MAG: hypothetical protein AMXMBFR23_07720 [Chloroflexota bacterium]